MNQNPQINTIRQIYRAHLARYPWARLLKNLYLMLLQQAIQIRAFFIWRGTRNLTIGAIYFSRLRCKSSLTIVRHTARWGASFFFALLRLLYALTSTKGWYAMQGFSEYIAKSNTNHRELVQERQILLNMPTVYPLDFKKLFRNEPWPMRVPATIAFEVSKAQVLGKSDIIFLHNRCLHHDLYRFDQDLLFEEMHGVVGINPAHKEMVRFKGLSVGSIPSAISLIGSTTANYVHWLTETLPKLALINGIDKYNDLPYLIDAGLHPNILESIRHINPKRKLVQIERDELLAVDRLIIISPVAYVPFDFHPGIKPQKLTINPDSALYSPDALQRVRQLLVSRLVNPSAASKRKLFLRRTGKSRPMLNSAEVEAMMLEHGFEIIEPETLNFADQVRLFNSAHVIVSQGGAALGNILFSPNGCHVIVLTTWSPYTIHYYFANLAAVLGQRCTLIMCEPVHSELGPHRAHMGVNVSISTLKKAISQ